MMACVTTVTKGANDADGISATEAKMVHGGTESSRGNIPGGMFPLQTASGRGDAYVQELDGEWLFGGRALEAKEALQADYTF